jgi:hypothetical protein
MPDPNCPTCGARWQDGDRICRRCGAEPTSGPAPELVAGDRNAAESVDPAVTYRAAINGDSPEAVLADMHLLNGVEDEARRKVQLLVAELIDPSGDLQNGDGGPQGLEVQLLPGLVRVSTRTPPGRLSPNGDPLEAWRLMIVERVADRWGVDDGGDQQVWFEIDRGAG